MMPSATPLAPMAASAASAAEPRSPAAAWSFRTASKEDSTVGSSVVASISAASALLMSLGIEMESRSAHAASEVVKSCWHPVAERARAMRAAGAKEERGRRIMCLLSRREGLLGADPPFGIIGSAGVPLQARSGSPR